MWRLSPCAGLRPLGARSRGSKPLSLQPVPEAWHLLPSPPSVSAQHGNEVAETVVNSSLEFMESFFSRMCRLLTDHQGRIVSSGGASSVMLGDSLGSRGSDSTPSAGCRGPLPVRSSSPHATPGDPPAATELVQPEHLFLIIRIRFMKNL